MKYLKSLFFNFLIVFFADYLLPGIEVAVPSKLPHIHGDLLFPIGLAILNSLIYPVLKALNRKTSMIMQMALIALILNFGAYALVKILPFGIHISSMEGYLFPAIAVAIVSFLTNYFEMKSEHHSSHHSSKSDHEPPL